VLIGWLVVVVAQPVMDGLAATQLIRERERMLNLPSTPVIGLSGNSRQQQISRALKGGMSDYMYAHAHATAHAAHAHTHELLMFVLRVRRTKPYEQHTIYSKLAQWTTDTPLGSPHAEARAASLGRPDDGDDDEEVHGAGTATATTTTTTQQENEEGKEKEKEEAKGKDGKKDEEDGDDAEEGEKEGDDGRRKRRQGRRRKSVVDNDGDNDDDEEEREPPPPSSPPTSEEDSIAEVGEEEHRGVGRR
jgi:CheY-like chemotaxis protein